MTVLITTLVAVAAGTVMATSAFARARHIRGPTPLVAIRNESMTLDKLQYPARTRTTRLFAATAAVLACGLFVFCTPNYSQTIAATESTSTPRRLRGARREQPSSLLRSCARR